MEISEFNNDDQQFFPLLLLTILRKLHIDLEAKFVLMLFIDSCYLTTQFHLCENILITFVLILSTVNILLQ